jgi:hypothetical protein
MKNHTELRQDTLPGHLQDLVETLTSLFTRAQELETLGPYELSGLRMGEVVRIHAARREFAQFRSTLGMQISSLHDTLDAALVTRDYARASSNRSELFEQASERSTLWRLQAPRNRKRTSISHHNPSNNELDKACEERVQ